MAITTKQTSIYLVDVGTAFSDLAASDLVKGEITNYSTDGFENDVEITNAVGGDIVKDKPTSPADITFDITPSYTGTSWETVMFAEDGSNAGTYTSANCGDDKMVVIQYYDGTNYKSYAWNNVNSVKLDVSHDASDTVTFTLNFRVSALSPAGVPNYQYKAAVATSLTAWSSLDTV